MKGVQVHVVALPGNGPAAGLNFQSGQVVDRAVGHVFAGDPFGIIQGQRPRRGRDPQARVQQLARRLGGIDAELDRPIRIGRWDLNALPEENGEAHTAGLPEDSGSHHEVLQIACLVG